MHDQTHDMGQQIISKPTQNIADAMVPIVIHELFIPP
jgi:hypothetical protein